VREGQQGSLGGDEGLLHSRRRNAGASLLQAQGMGLKQTDQPERVQERHHPSLPAMWQRQHSESAGHIYRNADLQRLPVLELQELVPWPEYHPTTGSRQECAD